MFRPTRPEPGARVPATAAGRAIMGVALALVGVAVCTALKVLIAALVGEAPPYALYPFAVLVAAWYGGLAAGLLATVLSAALGFSPWFGRSFAAATHASEDARVLIFAVECIAIAMVTTRLRRLQERMRTVAVDARMAAAKLDVILTGVDDGITLQDPHGRLLYANQPAARLTGFPDADALVAASPDELERRFELLSEDGEPFPLDDLPGRRVLRGEPGEERLVRFRRHRADDERYSLVRSNPVRDTDGTLTAVVNTFHDITERRKQTEAIRLSREWLATSLRSIGDAVITTDRAGVITFMNPVAEQLTGWTMAAAEGRRLRDVFVILAEDTRETVASPVERVMREGVVIGLANHTILVRRDGGELAIDDSAAPIRTDGGELAGVVLVFRDVTAERLADRQRTFVARAVEQLNSSLDYERTLATIARLAVPTIADWSAVDMVDDGQVRRLAVAHVDPAKVRFVEDIERRYPPDPDAPQGVHNIIRTGQAEMVSEIPASLIEAGARDAEHLRLIRELSLHSYIAVPIKRGERTIGVISFVTAESRRVYREADLAFARSLADRAAVAVDNALLYREAQQARADAALERDRLAALIQSSPTGIAIMRGPELRYELINEPYLRIVPLAAIGKRARDLLTEPGRAEALAEVLRTGHPLVASEHRVERPGPDGDETMYVDYTVQPLRDAAGRPDRLVTFARDVTEQVSARRRVEAARAEAELANRSKDEFLAMLGHELRNPLAPIMTAVQLMSLRGDDGLQHERTVIERQLKHIVRLVDDLLDVSRITRGKVELRRERVELAEIVADAIEQASPLFEQGRQVLETDVPRHGLVVLADRQRLAQVIANLLNNASKYTEPGGRIIVTGSRQGERVLVQVRDTGIGIAPEMLSRIFDVFVQQPQAIDRSRGGLGLGLTIVKNLVAMHDGEVSATSDGPGKGTQLTVSLPAAGDLPTEPVAAPAPPPRAVDGGSTRVLIVDDNEDAADLLSMVLEARGFVTRVAADGPSALRVASEFKPTTALLDIGLPVMDGFELARRLRAMPELAPLRLIAVTGYGQDTDRQRSRDAGFDHHLVKPIDIRTVVELLGIT
jgi:PAS domain S-box-containing protein